ncbi:hypothetical protein OAF85_00895 [Planctomycetota bacterium]|nr:hypothetical protein [Planctomycetota bacterium]
MNNEESGPEPRDGALEGMAGAHAASRIEGKYQYSKYHTKGGHGFAGEDANQVVDELWGRKVELSGRSNVKDGADRIVDSVPIQTKYYQSAKATVSSAFDSASGQYRYGAQMLEVPSDQYAEAVQLFRDRIEAGQVPGVTNPGDAEKVVRKGQVSYQQAKNIARAGNLDSLSFDAKTQAVSSLHACAISFGILYARGRWSGMSNREAMRAAIASGLQAGATTFVAGIVTAQLLRSRAAAVGAAALRNGVRVVAGSSKGSAAIRHIATASLGRSVYGAAATNHVAKLLRTNAITAVVTTTVLTAPDFYRAAFSGSVSWTQFSKNLGVNASGVGGGVGGWMSGAAMGGVIGGPPGALVGGLVGGVAGGFGGSILGKKVADKFADDDAVALFAVVQRVAEEVASEFMLSEKELDTFVGQIKERLSPTWLREMYAARGQDEGETFARTTLEKLAFDIASGRPQVMAPTPGVLETEIVELTADWEDPSDPHPAPRSDEPAVRRATAAPPRVGVHSSENSWPEGALWQWLRRKVQGADERTRSANDGQSRTNERVEDCNPDTLWPDGKPDWM